MMDSASEAQSGALAFRGRLEENDFVHMCQALARMHFPRGPVWLLSACALLLMALGAVFVSTGWIVGTDSRLIAWFVPLMGAYLAWWVFSMSPPMVARRARRRYRRDLAPLPETELTIAPESIKTHSDRASSEIQWVVVSLVVDARHGLLFCGIYRSPLLWLPDRVFKTTAARSDLLDLAKAKGIVVQRLS